jgi:TPR repeat
LAFKSEYDRAIANYTKAIELNPNTASFYYSHRISYAAIEHFPRNMGH